jgi:hypothetical protein
LRREFDECWHEFCFRWSMDAELPSAEQPVAAVLT